jgi:hypothetical protein
MTDLPFAPPVVGRPVKTFRKKPVEKEATPKTEVYTPMLVTDNMSVDEMQNLVEKVRLGGLRAVDVAIQRGRFEFSDIEAITAALAVMLLNPMCSPQVAKISSALNPHLDRLAKLIKDRDLVELNEESADRIREIEAALQEMASGT